MSGDVFDVYPTTRKGNVTFNPALIEQNSGHRLLCKRCKDFRRFKIEIAYREDGRDVLRAACKTCGTFTDYVAREIGLVPEAWAKHVTRFTMRRAKEILLKAKP